MNTQLLYVALAEYGVKEIKGSKHNSEVLKYFTEIGHNWVNNDETAWCSAFLNWCAKTTGLEYSGKLDARSWLKVGEKIIEPDVGDIVIFWRSNPESWKGHVGIYINQICDNIYVLGGNQSNQVNISSYPKSRLLGYRRLNANYD